MIVEDVVASADTAGVEVVHAEAIVAEEADEEDGVFNPIAHHGDDDCTCKGAGGKEFKDFTGQALLLPQPAIEFLTAHKRHLNCNTMLALLGATGEEDLQSPEKICAVTRSDVMRISKGYAIVNGWTPPDVETVADICPVECAKFETGPCAANAAPAPATVSPGGPVPFAGLWTFGFL